MPIIVLLNNNTTNCAFIFHRVVYYVKTTKMSGDRIYVGLLLHSSFLEIINISPHKCTLSRHYLAQKSIFNTWRGYKITGFCKKIFYSKNYTIEMLSPSMYSPSRSLHRSLRIFHCWKQCCSSSSDILFMSSVAFAFTASTDSNLVLFNSDLILLMGLGKVSAVDVPTRWSCASSKTSWQAGRCVQARRLGEEPMSCSSKFQIFFFSSIYKCLSKHPWIDLVNGLTFRHKIHVNNSSDAKSSLL